jgi:hypothetical protein
MSKPTPDQLHTLRHILGINDPSKRVPKPYRNYAAVNPGDPEFVALEVAGLVERYRARGPGSEYDYFRCTEAGHLAAMRSFRTIRYSPAKRRYIAFLNVRDCFPDLTFKQFVTLPEFAEARKA